MEGRGFNKSGDHIRARELAACTENWGQPGQDAISYTAVVSGLEPLGRWKQSLEPPRAVSRCKRCRRFRSSELESKRALPDKIPGFFGSCFGS